MDLLGISSVANGRTINAIKKDLGVDVPGQEFDARGFEYNFVGTVARKRHIPNGTLVEKTQRLWGQQTKQQENEWECLFHT